MKRMMTFGVAGLLLAALPAAAMAQSTMQDSSDQTAPQRGDMSQQQTVPQDRQTSPQQKQTMPQKMNKQSMPMRKKAPDQAKQEVATAHAHALMAQNAKSIDMVHTHLHHVINCLEGPNGTDFDASAGNPCKDKGQGALVDSQSDASMQTKLKQALDQARSGVGMDQLQQAQQSAAKVASMLQVSSSDNGMMHHQEGQ